MESSDVSDRENQPGLKQGCLREEGELSDDENDEDAVKLTQKSSKSVRNDIASNMTRSSRSHSRSGSRGESTHSSHRHGNQSHSRYSPFEKERHSRNPPISSRHTKHIGRKRGYGSERSDDESHRSERISQSSTPSSKIWENRRFRASSVRPRIPPLRSVAHENQHELLELVKEQERIREQLQSLEEEEKRSSIEGEERGRSSEDEYILDMIEQFPDKQLGAESIPASPKLATVPADDNNLQSLELLEALQSKTGSGDVEESSDDEDTDEQKLRILALATSARHNQLLARGIQNENTSKNEDPPPVVVEPVVIIPDVEPLTPEPEVVVVPEDEDVTAKEPLKDVAVKTGEEKKGQTSTPKESKGKAKSRSKRKKKGSSKQDAKKKSPTQKEKIRLSGKDWAQQRKMLRALALEDPKEAFERILKMAKESKVESKPAPPKMTGTMGDFKRQKHLPLLSETQKQAAADKKTKSPKAPERRSKKGNDKKGADVMEDNYEEVEMEITSDCEEKEMSRQSGDTALERLNLGAEFSQAMQPIQMMPYIPGQLDNGMLASMVSVYQVPHFSLLSSTMENLSSSSSQAPPPLPHQPPPLPPPPPPLPIDSPDRSRSVPSRSMMELSAYVHSRPKAHGIYSGMESEYSTLTSSDSKIYQNGQESGHEFSPELRSSSRYSSLDASHISFLGGKRSEEGEKRLTASKSFSIADISSQLHRIRKEQERGTKGFSKAVEEPGPPSSSLLDSVDISQGFWSKEEWKNSANQRKEPLKRKKSPLSPQHQGEEYRPSSHKDSLYFSHDVSYDYDLDDHPARSLRIAIDSYDVNDNHPSNFNQSVSSSSSSVSSSQRDLRRRRTSKTSSAANESSVAHQGDSSETGDVERDSDDENELRKQLLSSLAVKRYSSPAEILKQDSPLPSPHPLKIDESDEEPVPPPVVKRVWTNSSAMPSVDNIDESYSSSASQPMEDGRLASYSSENPSSEMNEEFARGDKLMFEKTESMSTFMPNSKWDSSSWEPDRVPNSLSERDHNLQSHQKSEAPLQSCASSSSVHKLSESSSRLLDTLQIKLSASDIQTSKPLPSVSSNSLVSEKLSPLRVQSPTSVPLPFNSKSVSSSSSSSSPVIKTIYSNSQSLPSLKTTMSNAVVQRPKGKSKSILERKMDMHRTSSPNTPTEDVGQISNQVITMDSKEVPNKHQKKYPTLEMPIHPSVIVPLHPSSDEEDEETRRNSVEDSRGQSFDGEINTDMKKLNSEEKLLLAQKKAIEADQERLRNLLAKAGDVVKAQRQAKTRAEILQAQIAALMEEEKSVSKMAKAQEQLKDRVKKEARDINNRLLKNKSLFWEKTRSVMTLGQAIFGQTFKPKALQAAPQARKSGLQPRHLLTKSQKIAFEKQKLREKELEIAKKLRVLKESTNSGRANKRKALPAFSQEKTSDIIHLGQENVDFVVPQKRRRSLLSTDSSSHTPNLPMTPKIAQTKTATHMHKGNEADVKNDACSFQMPKGSQLSNLRKILMEEKVEKTLTKATEKVSLNERDFYSAFNTTGKETRNLDLTFTDDKRSHKTHEKENLPAALVYSSPLKMLRSYRFSKFYRTKECLSFSSKTFSHKINPDCIMCPYDLQGTCNDDNCKQQHPKDYELSDRELLEDLVSYHPEVAGVRSDASKESIRKAVGKCVDAFLAKHKDRLTVEEMCLLFTSEVKKFTGVRTTARHWRLDSKEEKGLSVHLERQPSFKNLQLSELDKSKPLDRDALIGEEDVRYFINEGTDTLTLEEAVLDSPQDIKLWLQLSARRLADPNRTPRECLDQALNVLARALEANRSDPELWLHYLLLYQKHADGNDFPTFCQTALTYAPSYELWFMYLNSLKTYPEKEKACHKALEFLCEDPPKSGLDKANSKHSVPSDSVAENASKKSSPVAPVDVKRSHQVLEMVVYYTNLNILTGRFKAAVKFLQTTLGVKGDKSPRAMKVLKRLTVCHTLVLWMIYIHVLEWRHLPEDLFPGANENPGRIITQNISLPWSSKPKLYTPLKTLVNLHRTAVKIWMSSERNDKEAEEQFVCLMKSLMSLLCSQQRFEDALSVCHKILSEVNVVDVWLITASLYATKRDLEGANKVFKDAVAKNEYCAKLQYYQNVFLCSQGKSEEALHRLEQFIISCFDSSPQSLYTLDPNLLFCHLLNLQEGFSIQFTSKPKPQVGTNLSKDVFMWLCYCQLLELQGEVVETIEVFERSLTQVPWPSDLVLVWQSYISFLLRSSNSSRSPPAMQDLLVRSIISTPMKLPLPFSPNGASIVDFRHSNRIVEMWLNFLPLEQRLDVVEKCLDYMPANLPLLLRGLELCISMKETRRAFCWSKMAAAQSEKPACLAFWKIASALANTEGTQKEVEHMMIRCAQVLPLAVSAWKDLLLFEVTREEDEVVSQILSQCDQLGLNIQDYVQTLSAKVATPATNVV